MFLSAAAPVRQGSTLSNDTKFRLDMLYSKTGPMSPSAAADTNEEEGSVVPGESHFSAAHCTFQTLFIVIYIYKVAKTFFCDFVPFPSR